MANHGSYFVGCEDTTTPRIAVSCLFLSIMVWVTAEIRKTGLPSITCNGWSCLPAKGVCMYGN